MIKIQIDVSESTPDEVETFLAQNGIARTLDEIAHAYPPHVSLTVKDRANILYKKAMNDSSMDE